MSRDTRYEYKVATEESEFDQIALLNYRTFVEEIPQHAANSQRRLFDRFLSQSTCIIALDGQRLVGMVAISATRPFSLDQKLPDLDAALPPGPWKPCEIRLLAIEPEYRGGAIFRGLMRSMFREFLAGGYTIALISAAVRQLRLYRGLGFVEFGPPLGTAQAPYQGMYVTGDALARWSAEAAKSASVPGVSLGR